MTIFMETLLFSSGTIARDKLILIYVELSLILVVTLLCDGKAQ